MTNSVAAGDEAHLGHVFQELGAGEAVLCGAAVGSVVEKAEELRIQLKESATDNKPRRSTDGYTQHVLLSVRTHLINLQVLTKLPSVLSDLAVSK